MPQKAVKCLAMVRDVRPVFAGVPEKVVGFADYLRKT